MDGQQPYQEQQYNKKEKTNGLQNGPLTNNYKPNAKTLWTRLSFAVTTLQIFQSKPKNLALRLSSLAAVEPPLVDAITSKSEDPTPPEDEEAQADDLPVDDGNVI